MITESLDYINDSQTVLDPGTPAQDYLFADALRVLNRRKKVILAAAVAGAALVGPCLLLIPNIYTAGALIMPPQQQQSSVTALLGQLGPIGSLGGRDLGIKNPSDLYMGILRSRTIADRVITKFNLQQLYRTPTMVQTRSVLASQARFESGRDGLIKISVDDVDAKRAADIANYYVDELYRQNSGLALTEAAQRRMFFERQLAAERKALADAEGALKATQERTGMLQVDKQTEAVMRSVAQLRGAIVSGEVVLERLKTGATAQNPEVIRQQSEVAALRAQLARLEATQSRSGSGDPVIPSSRLPQVGLEYVRSYRDLKYHETLFELLAKQYEGARIDEAKQAPLIQVVDRAVPPDLKSWPPRAVFTAIAGVIAGLLAWAAAFVYQHFRRPAFG